jgi:hypothetical protein
MWNFTYIKAAMSTGRHTRPRTLLLGIAIGLTVAGVSACGSADRGASSGPAQSAAASARAVTAATVAAAHERDGDGDIDTLGKAFDSDNDTPLGYAPPAGPVNRRAIVALLRRYYTTAAAGDGASACSLLDPLFAEQITEEHRPGKGPRSLQGATCARVMSKLFRQRHRELAQDAAEFRVGVVELRQNRGLVLMPYATAREMEVVVHRDDGVWRMDVAVDKGAQ